MGVLSSVHLNSTLPQLLWTCSPDALLLNAQAAYLYVILERAGVQPAKATPAQMQAMAQQLAELSPQAPNVPPHRGAPVQPGHECNGSGASG